MALGACLAGWIVVRAAGLCLATGERLDQTELIARAVAHVISIDAGLSCGADQANCRLAPPNDPQVFLKQWPDCCAIGRDAEDPRFSPGHIIDWLRGEYRVQVIVKYTPDVIFDDGRRNRESRRHAVIVSACGRARME